MVHLKGFMYKWIMEDLGKTTLSALRILQAHCCTLNNILSCSFTDNFILRGEETEAVLNRLVGQGKKLFLITNSPFGFV